MPFDPYQHWLQIPPERRPPTSHALLGLPEGEPLGDAETLALGEPDGLALGLADALALGEALGEPEGLALGLALGLADGLADGDAEGLAEGLALSDALGLARGDALGEADGEDLVRAEGGILSPRAVDHVVAAPQGVVPEPLEALADAIGQRLKGVSRETMKEHLANIGPRIPTQVLREKTAKGEEFKS